MSSSDGAQVAEPPSSAAKNNPNGSSTGQNGPAVDDKKTVATPPNPSQAPASKVSRKQWLQVLSSFMVFLNSWGLLLTFGSFQTYYETTLLPGHSSSSIAWVSTLSAFLLPVTGLLSGPAFDYGYLRTLIVGGTLLEVFGLMMISVSTRYYQVLLAQGICVGLACGMLYIPSIAAAGVAFPDPKMRAKMMGLIASASGIGGVIYPIMFDQLVTRVGFGWAVRAIAFVVLGTYIFSYPVLLYPSPKPANVRRLIDASALRDLPFINTTLAGFFSGIAYYVPLLYLPLFAETSIPGFNNTILAIYLISIVNGVSIFGRVLGGLIAARVGPLETYCAALGLSAVLLLAWIAVDSMAGVVVWSVFWGLVSSVIVSLPGAFVPLLCPSLGVIGTRSGMFWSAIGLGLLIGAPIAGALIENDDREPVWWRLQVFSGVFMLASSFCVVQPVTWIRGKRATAAGDKP